MMVLVVCLILVLDWLMFMVLIIIILNIVCIRIDVVVVIDDNLFSLFWVVIECMKIFLLLGLVLILVWFLSNVFLLIFDEGLMIIVFMECFVFF